MRLCSTLACALLMLQCLLHMPQFEFAVRTAESITKVQNSGQNWGMCSKHCNTKIALPNLMVGGQS